jgi:hypothetical protein
MEHMGIIINYADIIKIEIRKIIYGLIYIFIIIVVNSVLLTMDSLPVKTRICLAITMSYPIVTMFIAEITFINIIRKVWHLFVFYFYKI